MQNQTTRLMFTMTRNL
jgi:uncharacterized membrane protein